MTGPMNKIKLIIIKDIVPKIPKHVPVLPVNKDLADNLSRKLRKVLPANIIIF